jgi:hypothetical protein
MAIETLPEPSIPITTPFRPKLGFSVLRIRGLKHPNADLSAIHY